MIKSLNFQDIRKKFSQALDARVRAITAGLGITELGAIMRGEPPTEKPNPRYKVHTTSFLFHIRPRYYELGSTIFTHTFRLGFLTSFFFFIEVFTGLILMVYYTPSPEKAYTSIVNLMTNVPFGAFFRDLHRLGAEGMVIFTTLHMLRTFLTGSYKKERSFTWLTGLALLGITLFLSFSGYLLPWDQLAYWAVTIGTSMAEAAPLFGNEVNLLLRGSPDIAANGLLRFYLLHVVLLPLLAILIISIHYYKVSREHGISQPANFTEEGAASPEKKKWAKTRVDFLPDLFTSEIFWTSLGLFLLVLAITVLGYRAPLENVANPQVTPLDTKAPWYFWWLQGMLKLGDKTLMGIILPTILVVLLIAIPYIDRNPYRSLYRRPLAVGLGILSIGALIVLSYMGLPEYGIKQDPATRTVQDLIPMEGPGPVYEIPFDQLQNGAYIVNESPTADMCLNLDFGCPVLEEVFTSYSEKINGYIEAGELPEDTAATMVIEDWQQDLKKVTLRITWVDAENKNKEYSREAFIHADRGSE
ncbi:MAG: cytochrome bc complex cytochrome b subunit [Anaerolineales bacterium]|jgi:quinol-cytochrome oxidoreductase complex cytochrome b subunit|nr:cytochrome bc complex cytochrome b subunit [Anaerolineales bacterium]